MARSNWSRVNFFDGQEVSETDLDVEQSAWHNGLANAVDFLAGSGVEKDSAVQRVLFDSDDVPASISSLISSTSFDGEPIYPTDAFGQVVFLQPSDASEGNQLEVEISGSSLDGTPSAKVFVFGQIFGGTFTHEVLVFDKNTSIVTRNYFNNIVSIMTQDFLGNQNTIVDGVASRNNGGRLRILEALPMSLTHDTIMAEQVAEPSMDYVNFKPATLSKTLDIVLDEIAATEGLSKDDLRINVTATTTRTLPINESTGMIVGQKFKATTNNIQKISVLLSVEENTLATPGQEFDWSGEIIVGIRALQTTTTCPTAAIPNTSIEFDPELYPLAEVSFSQNDLEDIGVILTDEPQVVDFVFTQSLLANPNIEPSIVPGKYYILTIRRSGDLSKGNIVLQEAENTNVSDTDDMMMSVFSQNVWTDIPESDLWFRIHTDAIRITSGTAFDGGVQITSNKTKKNDSTGVLEPYVNGYYNLLDISSSAKNYVIVQKSTEFSDSIPHPSTGNQVFTRILDVPDVVVVSEDTLTTLIDAGTEPIILGYATDTNPIGNPSITGYTEFPGLARSNTLTLINPSSDITNNNLVGSILTPNTGEPELKYRIIKVQSYDDAYGDINNDLGVDVFDVSRALILDGYSKTLVDGTVSSVDQQRAIVAGTVTMEEIIRADVTNDGEIDILDAQLIQQNISLGTSFSSGSTFNRVVITVESLTSPLSTTPNIIGSDSSFNDVPFSQIQFRIDFVPLWTQSNITIVDLRRFVPNTFTQLESDDITGSTPNGGKNVAYIPGDLLLGGNLLTPEGESYSVDLEVNTITIDLPDGDTQGEVDIFTNFIKNKMYFSDGSLVTADAITDNQIKVSAAIGSLAKNNEDLDGYDFQSIDGVTTVDTSVSVLYMQEFGLLRIRAYNIKNISTVPELKTKIILTVFLKKAGFANSEVEVTPQELSDILTVI